MRLDNFIDKTLNEKVTKKEKYEALNNDNIWIGAEFEFKLDTPLGGSGYSEDEYDSAMTDYNNYNESVGEYEDEIDEYVDATEDLKGDVERLEEKQGKLEDSVDESNSMIDDINSELEEIEDATWEDSNKIYPESPKDRKEFLEDRRDDIEDTIKFEEEEIEEIETQIDSTNDEIKYRENEGRYEEIESPVFDKYTYSDYIDYMNNAMGYGIDDITPEYGERLDHEPEYYSGGGADFVDTVEGSDILDDFPYTDYEVGEYGSVDQKKGDTTWGIESDETVTGDDISGMEVKSPPMKLPKFIPKVLKNMFSWINDIGYTDTDCGFHIHMSLDKTKGIDPLKLIMFLEEGYIYNIFPDREGSTWVKSVKDKLKTKGSLSKADLKNLANRKDMLIKISSEHTDGVNILDLETGHVEFRYMGSTDYSEDIKGVTDVIASYAYWLSLAADPEFKRKEYLKKINRVVNKMELFEAMYQTHFMKAYKEQDIHGISKLKLDDMIAKTEKTVKSLKKIYKIDKKTIHSLNQNTEYTRSILKKIKDTVNARLHNDDKNEPIYNAEVMMRMLSMK